ncbi:hypothetical protein [Streptomyces sp. NPDC001153]
MNRQVRRVVPWIVGAAVGVFLVLWWSWGSPARARLGALGEPDGLPPGPMGTGSLHSVPLPGGGMSDGDHCGAKGYHFFPVPPGAHAAAAAALSGRRVPGPQLVLLSYGGGDGLPGKTGPYRHQWTFSISFGLGPGPSRTLSLAQPIGAQGVAVEIEGPHGLVAGAHRLPVSLHGATTGPDHRLAVRSGDEVTADLTLPLAAVCPGIDAGQVEKGLSGPIDAHNTVIGQPPYRLFVSISDPSIGALRAAVHAPVAGDALTGDNLD